MCTSFLGSGCGAGSAGGAGTCWQGVSSHSRAHLGLGQSAGLWHCHWHSGFSQEDSHLAGGAVHSVWHTAGLLRGVQSRKGWCAVECHAKRAAACHRSTRTDGKLGGHTDMHTRPNATNACYRPCCILTILSRTQGSFPSRTVPTGTAPRNRAWRT